MWKRHGVLVVVLLLLIPSLTMFIPLDNLSPLGVAKALQPPPIEGVTTYWNGDWLVNSDAVYQNQTIIVSGNITVTSGFTLTLINVTIMMNCTQSNSQYRINVTNGGSLYILDYDWDNTTTDDASVISDSPYDVDDGSNLDYTYAFHAWAGAVLWVRNSRIWDCGWDAPLFQDKGIYVEANAALFDHVDIDGRFIGIIFAGSTNSRVDNCSIDINGFSDLSVAIYTWNSPGIIITNNMVNITTTWNDDIGLFVVDCVGAVISGNQVYMYGTLGWNQGIFLVNSRNYIVAFNNISLYAPGVGLHFQQMDKCYVVGNNIFSLVDGCTAVHITDLTDSLVGWGTLYLNGAGTGVYLEGALNNTFIDHLAITGNANYIDGIFLGGAKRAMISNITMVLNGIGSFGLSAIYSENITVRRMAIFILNTDGAGISVYDGTNNFGVDSVLIETSGNSPALAGFNCTNVYIVNSTLNASATDDVVAAKNATIVLLNVTFTDTRVIDALTRLIVLWYLHVQVLDEYGQPFTGVNLRVVQADATEVRTGITDSNGWMNWTICMGHVLTESGMDNSSNLHTARAYNATCWDEALTDLTYGGQIVTIILANDDPVITDPLANIQVQEDSTDTHTFHATDKENNPLNWSINASLSWIDITTLPAVVPAVGRLTITPSDDEVGIHIFTIRVTDINGGYDEFSTTIEVLNRDPVIQTPDVTAAMEDSPYSVDYDSDDDPATNWTLVSGPSWLNIDNSTGVLSGTPNNTHVGSALVNISVEDYHGGITWREFMIDVGNTLPMITTSDVITATEDTLYQVDYASTDDNQGTVTWSLVTQAGWLSINTATGEIFGTPLNSHVGDWRVNVTVDDGNGGIDFTNFTLAVINTPPNILTENIIWANEDAVYSVNYASSDDGQGVVVWNLATNAAWLSINTTTGVISGTPRNEHVGSYWVNVSVNDGNGGFDSHNFSLTVNNTNDAPVITTQDVLSATEDQPYSVDYEADDDDGDTLNWSVVTTAGWLSIDPAAGELTGTPTNSDAGNWDVTVICDDGNGGTDSHSFTINVASVNDAPVITYYLPPEMYPTIEEGMSLDFNITYYDEDSNTFNIAWTLDGQTVRDDVPFWSYEPDFGAAGDHEIIVNVTDDGGASAQQRWIVIVTQANRAPVIEAFEPMNLKPVMKPEETSMTFSVNASDPDNDQLTFRWLINGNDTGERTHSFTLDRSAYGPGIYNLTLQVTDEDDTTTMQSWSIEVKPVQGEETGFLNTFTILAIVIAAVIIGILIILIIKKRQGSIEDIFIISNSGLLLAHKSKELRPDMDDDILGSMLTAIQDFVKDSFKDKSKYGLKRLDFGDSVIHIKRGKHIYVAVVLSGAEPTDLEDSMEKTISKMESKYENILQNWDGDISNLRGLKDMLDDVLK